jgi:bis(5'-nucleosyl)-tetraphosphatase (symmetrical)
MSNYLIGDLQGCNASLGLLLDTISFSPSTDCLYFLGDLINRGPDNVGVIKRLMDLQGSARCILGNHDLHFLAVERELRSIKEGDTVKDILSHKDRSSMVHWLRAQPLALEVQGLLLVHAGVHPSWDRKLTLQLAQEVQSALNEPGYVEFLVGMYGNDPYPWSEELNGMTRMRFTVNTLTRMRFCDGEGRLDFAAKSSIGSQAQGFFPWFDAPQRNQFQGPIAFGHWSSVGGLHRSDVICLDTGCVWGRTLSAFKLPPVDANSLGQLTHECALASTLVDAPLIEGQWFSTPSMDASEMVFSE